MPGVESDVAVLVRVKAAREKALAAVRTAEAGIGSRQDEVAGLQRAARSRWPACLGALRTLAADYQRRSGELGVSLDVEELVRLRSWLPDFVVHLSRTDGALATRVLFRMSRHGRTSCRIEQTRGPYRPNLNRDEHPIAMSERTIRILFRTIVQILIVR